MFRALGRVGVRFGVIVGLILIVGGIVAVARLANTSESGAGLIDDSSTQESLIVDPTIGDDGEVLPTPNESNDAAIQRVADDFVAAWLRRELSSSDWHARLATLCTNALSASLEGVDPRSVPAARTVGRSELVLRSEVYAQVTIPVDTGNLLLGVLSTDGRWLVDSVDWERA